tara:strand:- start:884 stop:1042 length:159 start_codon:yes stop_codon:yes gene_type:complete
MYFVSCILQKHESKGNRQQAKKHRGGGKRTTGGGFYFLENKKIRASRALIFT